MDLRDLIKLGDGYYNAGNLALTAEIYAGAGFIALYHKEYAIAIGYFERAANIRAINYGLKSDETALSHSILALAYTEAGNPEMARVELEYAKKQASNPKLWESLKSSI